MLSAFSIFCLDASCCFCWRIGTLFELVSAYLATTTSRQHWLEHYTRANWNNKISATCYHGKGSWLLIIPYVMTFYLGCGGVPLDFHSRKNTCLLQRFSAKGSSNTNREIPQKKQSCLFRTNPLKNVYPPWNPTWPLKKKTKKKIPIGNHHCERRFVRFREGNQKKISHRLQHRTLRRSIQEAKSKPPESLWTLNLGMSVRWLQRLRGGIFCGVFLFLVFVCVFFSSSWWFQQKPI